MAEQIGTAKCVQCGKEYAIYDDGTTYDLWYEGDHLVDGVEPLCSKCLATYHQQIAEEQKVEKRRMMWR